MATGSSIIIGTANFTQAGGTFNCGDALFACGPDADFELEFLTNFINHERT